MLPISRPCVCTTMHPMLLRWQLPGHEHPPLGGRYARRIPTNTSSGKKTNSPGPLDLNFSKFRGLWGETKLGTEPSHETAQSCERTTSHTTAMIMSHPLHKSNRRQGPNLKDEVRYTALGQQLQALPWLLVGHLGVPSRLCADSTMQLSC